MTENTPPPQSRIPGWLLAAVGLLVLIGLGLLAVALLGNPTGQRAAPATAAPPPLAPTALSFPSRTPVPSAVPPTDTPPPTRTPLPTPTASASPEPSPSPRPIVRQPTAAPGPGPTSTPIPTPIPPTATPQPGITGSPTVTNNDHNHLLFAFSATNQTGSDINYGVLGVRAHQDGQEDRIQPSWSDQVLKAGQTLAWDDWMKINPGSNSLTLVICYDSRANCIQEYGPENGDRRQIGGRWETLSAPVIVP
ncbi:MAG: hypothetical protein HY784_12205 [Chloroflexi bacterium]|nr:hypothetical protein [Chloroflexota bacterium]